MACWCGGGVGGGVGVGGAELSCGRRGKNDLPGLLVCENNKKILEHNGKNGNKMCEERLLHFQFTHPVK